MYEQYDDLKIKPAKLLAGYDSFDNSYLIKDYPYGRRLRCQMRIWVETALRGPKGRKVAMQRSVSRTSDPKRSYEHWNAPKPSTYSLRVYLYEMLNAEDEERVRTSSVGEYGMSPVGVAYRELLGIVPQMSEEDQEDYRILLKISQAKSTWKEDQVRWERLVETLGSHLVETGVLPEIAGPEIKATRQYVNTWDYQVAVAHVLRQLEDKSAA